MNSDQETANCSAVRGTPGYAHAVSRPIPIQAVAMSNGFWQSRMESNRNGCDAFLEWLDRDDQTAPFRAFSRFVQTGDATDIAPSIERLRQNEEPHPWRANTQAWLEACALMLQSGGDPALRSMVDEFVEGIVAAHKNSEFLEAYYGDNYEHSYDLATPGHMIQAAIAHRRATGSTAFLDCAMQVVGDIFDKFLHSGNYAGHACIEMALVELYRETGDQQYLQGAKYFLDQWLHQRPLIGGGGGRYDDNAWHADTWCGRHVVRQPYLCAAAADYLAETGDPEFHAQVSAIWDDMTVGKSHLSGAIATSDMDIGAEQIVERPFDLSAGVTALWHGANTGAAASCEHSGHQLGFETCEAVGTLYWNWRMLQATGETKYADAFERVLYNNFLAHVSLDGMAFDYVCGLASDGNDPPRTASAQPVTSCCSPNALRIIAAMPGFIFSASENGLWIHNYASCSLEWQSADGTPMKTIQKTSYPWNGEITIEVLSENDAAFDLNLRIPGWCRNASVKVNGAETGVSTASGTYCKLTRTWSNGDVVVIDLDMPILAMEADPRALAINGKIAFMRGPLLYCFEEVDNPGQDVSQVSLADGIDLQPIDHPETWDALYRPCAEVPGFDPVWEPDMLGGITVLRRGSNTGNVLTAIPYFAFRNRGPALMRVWVRRMQNGRPGTAPLC